MALPFNDGYAGPDGAALGGNYSAGLGTITQIDMGGGDFAAIGGGGGTEHVSIQSSETYNADQKATARILSNSGTFKSGVALRCSGTGATFAGVGFRLDDDTTVEYGVWAGGSFTFIGSVTVTAWADNVDLEVRLAGTTAKLFRGPVQQGSDIDLSGASIPSSGKPALYVYNQGIITQFTADNNSSTPTQLGSAGCTPTAALTNKPLPTYAAGVTPTAALTNKPLQTLNAGVTPVGSLGNTSGGVGSQTLNAGVTPAANLTNLPLQVFTAGVTPSATLSAQGRQTLNAGMTPAGELDLLVFLDSGALSAVVAPTANLSNQATITQSLAGSVTPTAALTNLINTNLAAGVTPAGSLVNKPLQTLAANVTPAAGLTNQAGTAGQQTLNAGVTPTATLTNRPNQLLSAGITPLAQLLGVTPSGDGAGSSIPQLKKRKSL